MILYQLTKTCTVTYSVVVSHTICVQNTETTPNHKPHQTINKYLFYTKCYGSSWNLVDCKNSWQCVLVLSGIVNFLHKCGAVFWACAENGVDNSGMFSYCWSGLAQGHGLFCFWPTPALHKELGGDTSDQGDITDRMVWCSACKAGRRRRNQGILGVVFFALLSHHYVCWNPACLEMAEHLPSHGSGE